jgi:Na+/H+ antiporter NhaA
MSLFISNLAYSAIGGHFGEASVLGVLCASVISALIGWIWLRFTLKPGKD